MTTSAKNNFSIGDLVWVPQNTEVQYGYSLKNGRDFGYYPGDHTDHPLHGIIIDKFNDLLDAQYVGVAVTWKQKQIICRLEDVFPLIGRKNGEI
jgi:hypothetical protein